MTSIDRLGVGLWTMQSTAAAPANHIYLYRRFAQDARVAERLGYASVWTAEHRVWYDGWCPALIHAQAHAAARTTRLRFGNAMLLAPQHDPVALGRAVATLDRLTGGRVDLGLGLGHREAEFDALGVRRDRRGRLMEATLATLAQAWAGSLGDEPTVQHPGPPIWIGGMAAPAIARAARLGHRLMLPQTLLSDKLATLADDFREQYEGPGRGTVGVLRDVWIEPDPRRAALVREKLRRHYREEAGAWWVLKGHLGFAQPEYMERQLARVADAALVGTVEEVASGLGALFEAGADLVVVRLEFDFVTQDELHEQLARVAEDVAPALPGPALETGAA
jgi:alkanesulfonate monooxygenase SsuD/methylene tetrahydromethanopterin reductase-like flavin-dependent oxidoreductase (luciferase family)